MPAKVGTFQRPFVPLVGVELYGHGDPNALADGKIAVAEDIVSSRIKAIAIVFPFIFVDFIAFNKFFMYFSFL
jgi:hypothetical protein